MSKNKFKTIVEKAIIKTNIISANSTTCGMFYQPKAPAGLKKFSKTENDK